MLAYTWMAPAALGPTCFEVRRFTALRDSIEVLRTSPRPTAEQLEPAVEFVDSVVGTSKFLHFLMPDRFSMWDRNMAKALGSRIDDDRSRELRRYAAYIAFMREWAEALDDNSLSELARFMHRHHGATGGPLRLLEYALFMYGKYAPGADTDEGGEAV
jgi:hypothetical protein